MTGKQSTFIHNLKKYLNDNVFFKKSKKDKNTCNNSERLSERQVLNKINANPMLEKILCNVILKILYSVMLV